MQPEQQVTIGKWSVTRTKETDSGGNVHEVIVARSGENILRFSPNATDAELQAMLKAAG